MHTSCDFLDVVEDEVHELIVAFECSGDYWFWNLLAFLLPFASLYAKYGLRIAVFLLKALFLSVQGKGVKLTLSATTKLDLNFLVHVLVQI